MFRFVLLIIFSLTIFQSCVVREFSSSLPFPVRAAHKYQIFMDRSISGIYIGFPQSSIEIIGEKILQQLSPRKPLIISNNKSTEFLEVHFKENSRYTASEFRLVKNKKNITIHKRQSIDSFKSLKGIQLGISIEDLFSKLGKSKSIIKDGVTTIVKYYLKGKKNSSFLITMDMPIYNAEYTFKNKKLIGAKWGVYR